MGNKHLKFNGLLTFFILLLSLTTVFAQEEVAQDEISVDVGKNLFKQYCGACHAKNMKSAATGPALIGSQENWDDDVALYAWIRNSQAMVASGHPRAVELWNEYKPIVMTSFEALTDNEIASILEYIDCTVQGNCPGAVITSVTGEGTAVKKETPMWLYGLLLALLVGFALLLARITGNLNRLIALKDGEEEYEPKTIWQALTSKSIVGFAIFAFIVFAGYTTVNNATNLGRQQGYSPEQPIKFSHETHAGLHKIECQYCHDGARRSKHSVIPATNTCMNCHRAITYGTEYGTAELTKIFASIGYNPSNNSYISNYDDMPMDSIKDVYSKWIADQYVLNNEDVNSLDAEGQRIVNKQWDEIVSSLTNDQKVKVQGPIEWIRIHNLPDHVYFNHAQHVTVGQLECQTCHGAVEEMEVLQQASPLSMGWCINCHRQTEVKFNSNDYYASYAKYHEELAAGDRDKVTVADIGGLECQKCHY